MIKILTIGYDADVEQPGSFHDGWKPVSFCRRHRNFAHPVNFDLGLRANLGLRRKLAVGLAFWLSYYEHGLSRWSLAGEGPRCPWDSVGLAGILTWSGKPRELGARTYQERALDARGFLEEYTDWCNGHCYWFRLDDGGTPLDSCGGLIGTSQLSEAINDALADCGQVIVKGEAADLAPYLDLTATIVDERGAGRLV